MNSLRSQRLEISAASVVAVSSLAAGLLGVVVGRLGSRRRRVRADEDRYMPATRPMPAANTPQWHSLPDLEAQLRSRDAELEGLRRDYELDTGLLKQEIRRLNEILADRVARVVSYRSGAHHEGAPPAQARVEGAATQGSAMRFSSLEDLAGHS